jgi:hypothetical protein
VTTLVPSSEHRHGEEGQREQATSHWHACPCAVGFGEGRGGGYRAYEGATGPYVRVAVELSGAEDSILTVNFRLDQVETANAA